MKTRITRTHRNTCIELQIDHGSPAKNKRDPLALASMTHFEGTSAWMLTDIRLHKTRTPSKYSGGLFSDDVSACFTPKTKAEAVFVRSLLREYTEEDGMFRWSTYEGLVRGTPRQGVLLETNNHIGYFTREDGLAYLKNVQAWWETYEGNPAAAKVDNPHRQPGESLVTMLLMLRKTGKLDAAALENLGVKLLGPTP